MQVTQRSSNPIRSPIFQSNCNQKSPFSVNNQTISRNSLTQTPSKSQEGIDQANIIYFQIQNFVDKFFISQIQARNGLSQFGSPKTTNIRNKFQKMINLYYSNMRGIEQMNSLTNVLRKMVSFDLLNPNHPENSLEMQCLTIIIRLVNDHKIIREFLILKNDLTIRSRDLMTHQGQQMMQKIKIKDQNIANMKSFIVRDFNIQLQKVLNHEFRSQNSILSHYSLIMNQKFQKLNNRYQIDKNNIFFAKQAKIREILISKLIEIHRENGKNINQDTWKNSYKNGNLNTIIDQVYNFLKLKSQNVSKKTQYLDPKINLVKRICPQYQYKLQETKKIVLPFPNVQQYSLILSELNIKKRQIGDLNIRLRNMQIQFNQQEAALTKKLEQQLNRKSNQENISMNVKLDQLNQQKIQLSANLTKIQNSKIQMSNQNRQLSYSLKLKSSELQQNKSIFTIKIKQLQGQIQQLENQNESLNEKLRKISEQMNFLKNNYSIQLQSIPNPNNFQVSLENQRLKQEIQSYVKSIQIKQGQYMSLSNEKFNLKVQLQNSEQQVYKLKESIWKLENIINVKEEELKIKNDQLQEQTKLIRKLKEKQKKLQAAVIQISQIKNLNESNIQMFYKREQQLGTQIRSNNELITKLHKAIQILKEEKFNLQFNMNKNITSLRQQLQKYKAQLNICLSKNQRLTHIQSRCEALQKENELLLNEKQNIQKKSINLQNLKSQMLINDSTFEENNLLKKKIYQIQSTVVNLSSDLQQKQKERINYQNQYYRLEKDYQKISKYIFELQNQKGIMEKVIQDKVKKIKDMSSHINLLNHEKSKLQIQTNANINTFIIKLQKSNLQKFKYLEQNEKLKFIQKEYESVKKEKETLISQNMMMKDKLGTAQYNISEKLKNDSIIKENNILKEKMGEFQSTVNRFSADLKKRQVEIQRYSTEVDRLKKDNQKIRERVFTIQNEKNMFENTIKSMQKVYNQKDQMTKKVNYAYNSFKERIGQLQSAISNLSAQLQKKEFDLQMAKKQSDKLRKDNENLNVVIKKYQQENTNLENAIKSLTNEFNNKQAVLGQINMKYEMINKQKSSIDRKYAQLMADKQKIEHKLQQRNQEIVYLNDQIQRLSNMNTEMVKQNQQISNNYDKLIEENTKLTKSNSGRGIQIQEKNYNSPLKNNKQITDLQAKLKQLNQERSNLSNNLKQKQTIISELEESLQSAKNQVSTLQISNVQLQTQMDHLAIQFKQEIRNIQEQKQKLSLQISEGKLSESQQSQIQQYKAQIQRFKRQNLSFRQSIANWEAPNGNPKEQIDSLLTNNLFQGSIIQGLLPFKKYLKQVIQNRYNYKIIKTRLVYSYDTINKINFHRYVDGIDNLLLIIKMANGTYTAGFSQGRFDSKSHSSKDGLIISLTNEKTFTLVQPNRRAITYDDFYIIFGNSELRLKSLENKLFSNFGISNGYYNPRGQKVSVLLGGLPNERELDLQHYQFYEVFFDYN